MNAIRLSLAAARSISSSASNERPFEGKVVAPSSAGLYFPPAQTTRNS
jgi:hypothetical protein